MTSLHGKRVLVTGGSGFLGQHVVARLPQDSVRGVGSEYDLRGPLSTWELFDQSRPQVVIHLAAVCGGIGANRAEPGRFLHDNLAMGMNVLEACRKWRVGKVVLVGTCCSYPKHCPVPFREETLWDGYPEETNAPYGLAKRMLFAQAEAYHQQYGLNTISLIPANLYGPGDNLDLQTSHVIPALIRKFVEARESGAPSVTLWGTGTVTREFLYVEDAAAAIVYAAECTWCAPTNIGTGREVSIAELAALVRDATGFAGEIVWDASMPDGQPRRCLDVSRAKKMFGWEAVTPLEDGLRRTVAWYEANRIAVAG